MISSQRTTILYQLISNLKLKLTDFITNFSLVDNNNAKFKTMKDGLSIKLVTQSDAKIRESYINRVIDLVIELIKYKPFILVLTLIIFQFALYDFDINEYIHF